MILEWVVAKINKAWKLRQKYGHKWNQNKKFSFKVLKHFFKVVSGNKFYNSCNKINQELDLKAPEMSDE